MSMAYKAVQYVSLRKIESACCLPRDHGGTSLPHQALDVLTPPTASVGGAHWLSVLLSYRSSQVRETCWKALLALTKTDCTSTTCVTTWLFDTLPPAKEELWLAILE